MAAYMGLIMGGIGSTSGVQGTIGSFYANRTNANAANQEAKSAAAIGEVKAGQLARRNRLLTAQQVAGYGGSGVDPTQGTPTDVMTADAVQGELDALMANYEGQVARQSKLFEAKQYKFQAKQDLIAGSLQAVFDPAGHLIKAPGASGSAVKAPTIQPGGSTSGSGAAMQGPSHSNLLESRPDTSVYFKGG